MVTLELPVYWTKTFKTKPPKKILLSLNWVMTANHFEIAKAKKWFAQIVMDSLPSGSKQIIGPYSVTYTYFYKNEKSDLPNVIPVVSKFLLDALQDMALTEEDNVKFCVQEHSYVGQKTKEPRVLVEIEEIK